MEQTPTGSLGNNKLMEVLGFGIGLLWLLLVYVWIAANVAGGHPTLSPLNPSVAADIAARALKSGGHPWMWVGASHVAGGVFVTILSLLLIVTGGAGALLYTISRGGITNIRRYHRASAKRKLHFGPPRGLIVKSPSPRRIVLGRYGTKLVATKTETSVLVIGPTRQGKTVDYCIPSIIDWQGPVIATTTKLDIPEHTAGYRSRLQVNGRKGQVHIYDPTGTTDFHNTNWAPIARCRTMSEAVRRAHAMGQSLRAGKNVEGGDHWSDKAEQLLGVAFFSAAVLDLPIGAVRGWIDSHNTNGEIQKALVRIIKEGLAEEYDYRLAAEQFAGIENAPERERGSIYSTTGRVLKVFTDKPVADSASSSDIDADAFLSGPNTLYLVAPAHRQEMVAPLFLGLIEQIVERAFELKQQGKRLPDMPLLLVLDEAANVAPLEKLPTWASAGLSEDIVCMSIFQDRSQMVKIYGEHGANDLVVNHTCRVILSGQTDPETSKYFSDISGTVRERQYTYAADGSKSYTLSDRPMVPVSEFREVPKGWALVIYDAFAPMRIRQRSWWLDRVLRYRTCELPYRKGARRIEDHRPLDPAPAGLHERILALFGMGLSQVNTARPAVRDAGETDGETEAPPTARVPRKPKPGSGPAVDQLVLGADL